ncbi:MAG: NAD(P)H-hydrate dehydratase [Candidatus Tritonobacter lacicola]|nr:NAD(P)H-hydrate dehydratase [Candidatus Tritonobacter lacicola]
MKLITTEKMRGLDEAAVRECGISSLDLMEKAGRVVARVVRSIIRDGGLKSGVLLLAGSGNNGGDAFVAARHLLATGVRARVILLADPTKVKGDARENLERLRRESPGALSVARTIGELMECASGLDDVDVIVDGVLGTGLKGDVRGHYAEAIFFMNGSNRKIVSIDIPSGLDGDSGEVHGVCVDAIATVTMGLPKLGLVVGEGPDHAGRVHVADIGIPGELVEDVSSDRELLVADDLYSLFVHRRRVSHKGNFGHVLIIAGSVGMTGAAALAAMGALRAGAGLVTVGIPSGLNDILEVKLTEAMTVPLPQTDEVTLSLEAAGRIKSVEAKFDSVVLGPGLSTHPETVRLVKELALSLVVPKVIDADGLNAFAGDEAALSKIRGPAVLTPHPGEMGRLIRKGVAGVQGDRVGAAVDLAGRFGDTVVLKGAATVIANPAEVFINSTGNPGMASGGMGDVLAGMIGTYLAQGMNTLDAAKSGVFIHGAAGDLAALQIGEAGLIASDLLDRIPLVARRLHARDI